jgi:Arc/MetJ-type ribon-helix-helix transcriptional regulator
MSLALDPQTEQRIQQETLRGRYRDPSALINIALDALAADEPWTEEEKAELNRSLDLARAQIARGEGISGKELREDYERRRAARTK